MTVSITNTQLLYHSNHKKGLAFQGSLFLSLAIEGIAINVVKRGTRLQYNIIVYKANNAIYNRTKLYGLEAA